MNGGLKTEGRRIKGGVAGRVRGNQGVDVVQRNAGRIVGYEEWE